MARVNVEQKALTDPRYDLLGALLGASRHDALGRMILIWNECQERASYTLPERIVGAILGNPTGADLLIEADLAERTCDNSLRIKGTEGRIEWLKVKRKNGRKGKGYGKLGGRPRKTPIGVTSGLPEKPPPAPAPAPAFKGVVGGNEKIPAENPDGTQPHALLANQFCHGYLGLGTQQRDVKTIAAYFLEFLRTGEVSEMALGTEIHRHQRNRTEPVWKMLERIAMPALNGKPSKPGKQESTSDKVKRIAAEMGVQ